MPRIGRLGSDVCISAVSTIACIVKHVEGRSERFLCSCPVVETLRQMDFYNPQSEVDTPQFNRFTCANWSEDWGG